MYSLIEQSRVHQHRHALWLRLNFTNCMIMRKRDTPVPCNVPPHTCRSLYSRSKGLPCGLIRCACNHHLLPLTHMADDCLCKISTKQHIVQVLILHSGVGTPWTAEVDHRMLLDTTTLQKRLVLCGSRNRLRCSVMSLPSRVASSTMHSGSEMYRSANPRPPSVCMQHSGSGMYKHANS